MAAKINFELLEVGEMFTCYGDIYIGYDYPKICRCIKIDEEYAQEILTPKTIHKGNQYKNELGALFPVGKHDIVYLEDMQPNDFNAWFGNHLEEGHYGMSINDQRVMGALFDEFTKEIQRNPEFEYSQIKLKFGYARVYTNSAHDREWENHIDEMLKQPVE